MDTDSFGDVEFLGRVAQNPPKPSIASDYVRGITRSRYVSPKKEAKEVPTELVYERFED
jgi:hypothetical protein